MCSEISHNILPEPPEELKSLSATLAALISTKIARNGPVSFSEYMEMVLYEPGLGYYSAGLQKFGRGGDFITAPQMGNVFARCLAQQIEQLADGLCPGQQDLYDIMEVGAGSGQLAVDLLMTLEKTQPPARYRILERSAYLRQLQKETLSQAVPQWMDRISWLDAPPEEPWQGVLLANEVLDALTVQRFCIESDEIRELQVSNGANGFEWFKGDCPAALNRKIQHVLSGLQQKPGNGFCSEINTHLPAWLDTVTNSLRQGLALFIDYGYSRHEYYRPQRYDGTLICHYQHRAHNDPFNWPGLTDISTSVDFTALAEAADSCGLEVSGYTTQAMFLMACGLDKLLAEFQSLAQRERLNMHNQVRCLTLPGEMGERFQVMALSRELPDELAENLKGFSLNDLCHSL